MRLAVEEQERFLVKVISKDNTIAYQIINANGLYNIFLVNKFIKFVYILCYDNKYDAKFIRIKRIVIDSYYNSKIYKVYMAVFNFYSDRINGRYLKNKRYDNTPLCLKSDDKLFEKSNNILDSFLLSLYVSYIHSEISLIVSNRKKQISLDEYFFSEKREKIKILGIRYKNKNIEYDYIYKNINTILKEYYDLMLYPLDTLLYDKLFNNTVFFINTLCNYIDINLFFKDNKYICPVSIHWFIYLLYGREYDIVSRVATKYPSYADVSIKNNRVINDKYIRRYKNKICHIDIPNNKYRPVYFEIWNNIPFSKEEYGQF